MSQQLHEQREGAARRRSSTFSLNRRRRTDGFGSGRGSGWLWVAPMLIFLVVFFFYPMFRVIYLSFFDASMLNPTAQKFVGLDNFRWLLTFEMPGYDGVFFLNVLLRTLLWVALSVGLKFVLGLGGANLLNQSLPGTGLFRSLTVLPWGLPWAIAAMTWDWTLNTQFGFVNGLLQRFGVPDPISFLGTPTAAFLSTVVIDAWLGLPFMVVVMLAGLQAVPRELVEAALVDGAGAWRRFRAIVWPEIRGIALTATLLSTVWTFNSFDPVWVLTRGGPLQATETLPIAVYDIAFRQLRFGGLGKASAMVIVQIVLVSMFAFFYLRLLRRGAGGTNRT